MGHIKLIFHISSIKLILRFALSISYNVRMRTIMTVFVLFLLVVSPVAAQTPTPDPTPTPAVVHGDNGDFVVVPEITYGQGGVIVAVLLVAGLLLVQIVLEVSKWLKQ